MVEKAVEQSGGEEVGAAEFHGQVADLTDDEAGRAREIAQARVEVAIVFGLEQGSDDLG